MKKIALKFGADPEKFVKKDGKFISAYGLIPGTKANPYNVNFGAVQVDGMALEFNIEPANSFDDFSHNITEVLLQLRAMLPPNLEVVDDAVAEFDCAYIAAQPDEARLLGCESDFNAYTGEENPPPIDHPFMRTAAGHIHIGWTEGQPYLDESHFNPCCKFARQLDYFQGAPSIIYDKSHKRRELYGKAGAFRPKSYGLEYRVLSNYWVESIEHKKRVYNNTIIAFSSLVYDKFDAHKEFGETELNAEKIINNNDIKAARLLVKELNLD